MALEFSYTEEEDFLIIEIVGEIRVNNILEMRREMQKSLQDNITIVLDITNVSMVDSSGLSLLVNMQKRLTINEKKFFIFGYNDRIQAVFEGVNLDKIIKLYKTKNEYLTDNIVTVVDDLYPPVGYDFFNRLFNQKDLICPICGSKEIKGFILNKDTQEIAFEENNIIPLYRGKEGNNTLDIYSMQITICHACFFASRHINYFKDAEDEFASALNEKEIHSLAKDISVRKRILSGTLMKSRDNFYPPFSKSEAFWIYTMAEESAHTLFRLENRVAIIDLAKYNSILSLYCGPDDKVEYLRKSYMWFTEIDRKKTKYAPTSIIETYYFLSIIGKVLKRNKEAEAALTELDGLNLNLPEYNTYLKAAHHFFMEDKLI